MSHASYRFSCAIPSKWCFCNARNLHNVYNCTSDVRVNVPNKLFQDKRPFRASTSTGSLGALFGAMVWPRLRTTGALAGDFEPQCLSQKSPFQTVPSCAVAVNSSSSFFSKIHQNQSEYDITNIMDIKSPLSRRYSLGSHQLSLPANFLMISWNMPKHWAASSTDLALHILPSKRAKLQSSKNSSTTVPDGPIVSRYPLRFLLPIVSCHAHPNHIQVQRKPHQPFAQREDLHLKKESLSLQTSKDEQKMEKPVYTQLLLGKVQPMTQAHPFHPFPVQHAKSMWLVRNWMPMSWIQLRSSVVAACCTSMIPRS